MRLFYVAFVYFFLHSVFVKAQVICGVKDTDLSPTTIKAMQMAPKWAKMRKNNDSDFFVCKLGVEIDAQTYHHFNGDSLLILAELTNTIEKVSVIFERDVNIRIVLSHLSLFKDATTDPNDQKTAFSRLFSLGSRWPQTRLDHLDLDVVMHLSVFQYSDASGIAFQPGNYNVSPWAGVSTIVHELGHNLGSPHTQSCEWPGGPIEHCAASEYGCSDGELLHQEELGTVMGYCKSSLKFHPLSVAVIEMEAGNRLTKISQTPQKPLLDLNVLPTDISHLFFKAEFQAEEYRYEFSENPGFSSILLSNKTKSNYISIGELVSGKKYYIRIKSINRFGSSDWSDVKEFFLPSNSLRPPFLGKAYSNPANKEVLDWNDAMVRIPITGNGYPDSYEIEMYDYMDTSMERLLTKTQIAGDSKEYVFVPAQNQVYSNFIIRVRSRKGDRYGAWSVFKIQEFDFSAGSFEVFFKEKNNMPLSFPIASYENTSTGDIKYFIKEKKATDFIPIENSSFSSDPVTPSPLGLILNGLKPDTEYIVQKQHSYEPTRNYQDFENKKIVKSNFEFKTGTFQNAVNYSFESKYNDPNSGLRESLPLFYNYQEIVYHERGITVKNLASKIAKEYNYQNTKGEIGNFTKAHNLDKELGIYVQLNEINKWTNNQSLTYAICKYDLNNNFKQLEKKEFSLPYNEYLKWVSFTGNYFWGTNGLYQYHEGKIEEIWNEVYSINIKESQNYIWIHGYNNVGILVLYKISKADNTPTFWGNCSNFDLDSNENVIALSTDRFYYGGNAQTINPLQHNGLAADKWGYVYLVSEDYNKLRFSKYKETQLIREVDLPPTPVFHRDHLMVTPDGSLQLNRRENVSLKVNMCDPILPPTSLEKNVGQQGVTLTAHGCENTLWRWKSPSGILKEVLQTGNTLFNAENETAYAVNCFKEGCSSEEKLISLVSPPEILGFRLEKDTICLNGVNSLSLEISRAFSEENEFNLLFYSKDKQDLLKTVTLESFGEQYRFTGSLPAGNYTVKVSSSNPESISKKELSLVIQELPAINITQKYVMGAVELSVPELPGVTYSWFEEGRLMTGETGHKITTNKPLIYRATVNDGVCQSHAAEHLVELALANENGSALIVYENPSITGIFYASLNMPSVEFTDMTVTDITGRILVKTKVKTNEKVEVNLKDFQPGRYVLKIGAVSRSLIKL